MSKSKSKFATSLRELGELEPFVKGIAPCTKGERLTAFVLWAIARYWEEPTIGKGHTEPIPGLHSTYPQLCLGKASFNKLFRSFAQRIDAQEVDPVQFTKALDASGVIRTLKAKYGVLLNFPEHVTESREKKSESILDSLLS